MLHGVVSCHISCIATLCIHIFTHICICIEHVYTLYVLDVIYIYIYIYTCMYTYIYIYVSCSLALSLYIHICVYIYIYIYMHTHVHGVLREIAWR